MTTNTILAGIGIYMTVQIGMKHDTPTRGPQNWLLGWIILGQCALHTVKFFVRIPIYKQVELVDIKTEFTEEQDDMRVTQMRKTNEKVKRVF